MKAIILAAGRGSRMKDLTDDKPKCLVELNGKALIDWQLEALQSAGIDDIAIVTGYRREMIADRGKVEFYNKRWNDTQMVSSLSCAEEWLRTAPCIVSYSDIFYAHEAVVSLSNSPENLALTYDPNWLALWKQRFNDPLDDAETFKLNQDGTVKEIGAKPQSIEEIEGQYMGLLKFTPESWSEIVQLRSQLTPDERDKMHMTGTLQSLINRGNCAIKAIKYTGRWGEVDSYEDLVVAQYNTK